MKYIELTIRTTSEASELVSDKLWEFTNYGVSVCDNQDVIELIENRRDTYDYLEDDLTAKLNDNVTLVKCYLDLDGYEKVVIDVVKSLEIMRKNGAGFVNFGTLETSTREVDGDDWIEIWRKHYRPIDLGKIVVCPKWIDYTKKEWQEVVIIDTNVAFGTGEHETTSMCIEFLTLLNLVDKVVLDVGTGSGILGMSAVKLGAKSAYMTDIDPLAVEAAKHNVSVNGILDKCVVTTENLLSNSDFVGDVIVANITADVLLILADDVLRHSKMGSIIILSGILRELAQKVVDKYTSIGFKVINTKSKGEWVALEFEKI